jgi:cytidylate kinase
MESFALEDYMADTENKAVSGMRAITVSREYGSGGGEVATRLAKKLGWKLINHEVVVQVAKALGITEEEAEAYDERSDNLVARVLYSLTVIQPPMSAAMPINLTTDSRAYDLARRRVVQDAYNAGQVVIVGRGGQVLLADKRDALHVRIVTPLEKRIAYVMQREGLDHAAAQARIQLKDRDRSHFLTTEHHQDVGDGHIYDLVVNTGVLDIDSVVDMVMLALERKATRLAVPAEELGPAAGMARYPEPPGSFTPPQAVSKEK